MVIFCFSSTDSQEKVYFFTGLHGWQRKCLVDLLDFNGPASQQLSMVDHEGVLSGNMTSITVADQLSLTLSILRRAWTYKEASYMFGVSSKTASSVFKTWLMFIFYTFNDMRDRMYTKRCDFTLPLPKCFNNDLLRNVRIILDCTEVKIEGSTNYEEQGNTYRYVEMLRFSTLHSTLIKYK